MPKTNIVPVSGMLLIRVNNDRQEEKAGIIIQKQGKTWQEEHLVAEVMNVSPDEKTFKVGDLVLIRGYEGRWLDPEYFEDSAQYLYRVVDCTAIMAKLEPKLGVI